MNSSSGVKISFTTILEDIPREVQAMIDNVRKRMREIEDVSLLGISDSLESSGKVRDCNEAIVVLDSARKELSKIDARMEDCMSILHQYCNVTIPDTEPEETDSHEERDEEG